jgi:hypothetical protein
MSPLYVRSLGQVVGMLSAGVAHVAMAALLSPRKAAR